ncbi:exodeoxyribonuclease VII large subunit [Congregibacter litoralis]|uniref:Exodeoxyribonuclease 7 large subunit n=1 Tax=Congregibacter litoralis KT71 TaxID=314285 RepID=A4ADE7_9GAMM|nr:exodeoxyribonuclease VII large subunit [Congregibacter litoralis]EAQ95945.1 Exodeoxyribonuclease VII large subunit [Congregibacter litoralis KT71]
MPSTTVAADVLSPSQLNRQARSLLESHFSYVWIEGELSNFARPSSGHWYFTLKDDKAQVRCAMFKTYNQRLRFSPNNGDQVRVRARVSLYEGRGEFQLIGEFLEPAGAGALQARFEALRDQLRAEGLFDAANKQPLPRSVNHLAVITSPTGAALQDILQVLARRNPSIRVTILPVAVQGTDAPGEIRQALQEANEYARSRYDCDFDAVIIARGGGSLEDLWAFNDEALAREIVASKLPVVSGVGHEVDVTIADFAADVRAPTPSAAAELLSEDRVELIARLAEAQKRLHRAMVHRLERERMNLDRMRARLKHPGDRLREQAQRLDELENRLNRAIKQRLAQLQHAQQARRERLLSHSPLRRLTISREKVARQKAALEAAMAQKLAWHRQGLERREQVLKSLNPLAILERGYAIISDAQGGVVRASDAVSPEQVLEARLARGRLKLRVESSE